MASQNPRPIIGSRIPLEPTEINPDLGLWPDMRTRPIFFYNRHNCKQKADICNNYRATLMHSATMPWQDVLSVCPSHAVIVCKRLYVSSTFFHRRVVPPFYSFSIPNGMTIFRRGPSNVGAECKGYEKITTFDQYRCLSRNWCNIKP